jgi:hypothetical protein
MGPIGFSAEEPRAERFGLCADHGRAGAQREDREVFEPFFDLLQRAARVLLELGIL